MDDRVEFFSRDDVCNTGLFFTVSVAVFKRNLPRLRFAQEFSLMKGWYEGRMEDVCALIWIIGERVAKT